MHCLNSLKNHTRFQSKMHGQSLHPFSDRNSAKAMPFWGSTNLRSGDPFFHLIWSAFPDRKKYAWWSQVKAPSRDTQTIYLNHYGAEFSFHHLGININKLNQSAVPGQSCVDMKFSSLKWLNYLVTCATSWLVEWRMLYFIFWMTMRLMRWQLFFD